jgi:hypothetical protein
MSSRESYSSESAESKFGMFFVGQIILPQQMFLQDVYAFDYQQEQKNMVAKPRGRVSPSNRMCNCREILSARKGFVCMTGARACPHCGLRIPSRIVPDFSLRTRT